MKRQAWIWTLLVVASAAAVVSGSMVPALAAAAVFLLVKFHLGTRKRNAEVCATRAAVDRILGECEVPL